MHILSRRGGVMSLRLGEQSVSVVETPLMRELKKRVESGVSVLVTGPHGVGKSVLVYSTAYLALEGGAVVVDLASDTSTFAEYIRLAKKAKTALAVFDAVPPQFYAEPEVWSEHAALWRDSCSKITNRADYVRRSGYPVILVLPTDLTVRCRKELAQYEKIVVRPEAETAQEIFLRNSEVFCGEDYAKEVAKLAAKWGEGTYYMAYHVARSLQYCDEDPVSLVEEARATYVERLSTLAQAIYAPTCRKARAFVHTLNSKNLPPVLASQAVHHDLVEAKVRTLERLMALIDKVSGPHREYVKILALQASEDLKRIMRPRWYVKALLRKADPLYGEALGKAADEAVKKCGLRLGEIRLRTLVKAYVIAYEASDDLAKAIAAVATGENPCIGKMRALCRRGALQEEVLDAVLNPQRLSIELPPPAAEGLERYAGLRAEDVGERGWIEVLNFLYESSERGRVDLRPFRDYVDMALRLGGSITKKLALATVQNASVVPGELLAQALVTAIEIGESYEYLLVKYVEVVGDASLIYERCGAGCGEAVVTAAVASAAKAAGEAPCRAIRQLEIALAGAGYGGVIEKYSPHKACLKPT
ncbi:MAG: ATP-binding protein [Pyrobaculum sp.]